MGADEMNAALPPGFTLDAPPAAPQAPAAASALPAGFTLDQPQAPGVAATAADVAKSGGRGLVEGAAATVGTPQDMLNLASGAMGQFGDWVGNNLFGQATPQQQAAMDAVRNAGNFSLLPTTQQTLGAVDSATGNRLQYTPQTVAGQYARTVGQFLPAAAAGGPRALAAAVPAALGSETAGQLTKGTEFEPYARVAGSLAAPAGIAAARRVVTPFAIAPERAAAVDTLHQAGVTALTPGQVTGNRTMRVVESELAPSQMAHARDQQGEQFTGSILQSAGINNAARMTPDVVDRGFRDWGHNFDALVARSGPAVPDQAFATDLGNALNWYGDRVSAPNRAPIIGRYASEISNAVTSNGGILPPATYQSLRSRIMKDAHNVSTPEVKVALGDMGEALDGMMMRSNPQILPEWQQMRQQYRNLLVVRKMAAASNDTAASGLATPSMLQNATKSIYGEGSYARGNTPFDALARAGRVTDLMQEPPNSGTPMRLAVRGVMNMPAVIGGFIGHGRAGDIGLAAGAAAGKAIPSLVGRAAFSPWGQAYLTNQLLQRRPVLSLPAATASVLSGTIPQRLQAPQR